jgi:hypothetical protein
MSSAYLIPFNFQPVNTVVGSSGTYTVPANMYAYATVTLNSTMGLSAATANNITGVSRTINTLSINSGSRVASIYLKAGDVLSFSTVNGNGVTSSNQTIPPGNPVSASITINTMANQNALVNSSIFTSAVSSLSFDGDFSGTATTTPQSFIQNVSTTASFSFIISEYNSIGV